jgi:hypothetical protein
MMVAARHGWAFDPQLSEENAPYPNALPNVDLLNVISCSSPFKPTD